MMTFSPISIWRFYSPPVAFTVLLQSSQLTSCSQAEKKESKIVQVRLSLLHSSLDGDLWVCFVSLPTRAYSSVKLRVNSRKGELRASDGSHTQWKPCLADHCLFLWPSSDQIRSVAQLCPTLCDPTNGSTSGLPVHHQLPECTQTLVHWVSDAIQPSHPLSFPSPPALNLSQHQGLFQWVSSLHQVAKVLEFQLQHQSFQWTPRTDFL